MPRKIALNTSNGMVISAAAVCAGTMTLRIIRGVWARRANLGKNKEGRHNFSVAFAASGRSFVYDGAELPLA